MRVLLLLLTCIGTLWAQEETEVDPLALEWFRKGEALIDTSRQYSEQQAGYFEKAIALAPRLIPARYNLVLIYIRQEKLDQALAHLNALTELEQDNPRNYLLRAGVFEQRGQFDLVQADIKHVLDKDPRNAGAWELLGRSHFREGRYQKSLEAFQKALELDPEMTELYLQLAQIQTQLEQGEVAVQSYEVFLEKHPDDFEVRFLLGRLYWRLNQHKSALVELLRAESLNPSDPDLAQVLGELYLELGDSKEAQKRLLRGETDNSANLGIIASREGRYQEAVQYLCQALEKDPGQSLLWAYMGDALVALDKKPEAIKAYLSALEGRPRDFSSLYNLASLHAALGQEDDAISCLESALQVKPKSATTHFNLALMLDIKQDHEQAQVHYLKAIEYGSEKSHAHFRLGIIYSIQKEPEKSIRHLEIAFEKDPEKHVPLVVSELRQVRSNLDSIRYRRDFNELLKKYQARIPQEEKQPRP